MKHYYLHQFRKTTVVIMCINIFLCLSANVNAQEFASTSPPQGAIGSQGQSRTGRFLEDILKDIGEKHSVSFSYETSLVEGVIVDVSTIETESMEAQLISLLAPFGLYYESTKNYYFTD